MKTKKHTSKTTIAQLNQIIKHFKTIGRLDRTVAIGKAAKKIGVSTGWVYSMLKGVPPGDLRKKHIARVAAEIKKLPDSNHIS
jgi:hypothetical protein